MQSLYCNKCGYPFPRQQPQRPAAVSAPAGRPAPRVAKRPLKRNAGGGGFLSFATLITENHLKTIYILGAVMIVLVAIMGIAGMFAKKTTGEKASTNASLTNTNAIAEYPAGSPLFWIVFLVIGNVLWRMFCELFAILYREHGAHPQENEPEPEYEYEPADYGVEEPAMQHSHAASGQMVECPKCHKIVPIEDLRECQHCGVQGCSNCIRMMGLLKKTMTCRECFEAK
jgi:hypothetical protein